MSRSLLLYSASPPVRVILGWVTTSWLSFLTTVLGTMVSLTGSATKLVTKSGSSMVLFDWMEMMASLSLDIRSDSWKVCKVILGLIT